MYKIILTRLKVFTNYMTIKLNVITSRLIKYTGFTMLSN